MTFRCEFCQVYTYNINGILINPDVVNIPGGYWNYKLVPKHRNAWQSESQYQFGTQYFL